MDFLKRLFGKPMSRSEVDEIREWLGPSGKPAVDPSIVPDALRSLVPLAAEFGIGDDVDRERALEAAGLERAQKMRQAVEAVWPDLNRFVDSGDTPTHTAFLYLSSAAAETKPAAGTMQAFSMGIETTPLGDDVDVTHQHEVGAHCEVVGAILWYGVGADLDSDAVAKLDHVARRLGGTIVVHEFVNKKTGDARFKIARVRQED